MTNTTELREALAKVIERTRRTQTDVWGQREKAESGLGMIRAYLETHVSDMIAELDRLTQADRSEMGRENSYASWQQRRGMLADTVDWAILEYDQFMLDDAYDSQRVLDRIVERLRNTRAALNPKREQDNADPL